MIKIIQKIKDLCSQEKSYRYYLAGTIIFLLFFIYYLFDKTVLVDRNILIIGSTISILFFIGFVLDSIKFIKIIWETNYGKIFHFIIALIVYAVSYSLSEKIIFINTRLDPNLLQSSIHLFTALFNIPVWLLLFQILLIGYTVLYFSVISFLLFIYYIYLLIKFIISEITKNIIPRKEIKNLLYKNKHIRINIELLKRIIIILKKRFIKKLIHSLFFIMGSLCFIRILPMDQVLFNPEIIKENNIFKYIIIFTSFYESNNLTCSNLEENKLVRFYGNSFSKVENKNGEIIFINNIKCE